MSDAVVVLVTTESAEEAHRIGKFLVDEHLAACVNVVGRINSLFRWEGEVCDEEEALMVIKSVSGNLDALTRRVQELHSYDVPEVIALPVVGGSQDYLDWVRAESGASE